MVLMVLHLIEQGVVVVVPAACNTFHVTAADLFFGVACLETLFDTGFNQFYHWSVVLLFSLFSHNNYIFLMLMNIELI